MDPYDDLLSRVFTHLANRLELLHGIGRVVILDAAAECMPVGIPDAGDVIPPTPDQQAVQAAWDKLADLLRNSITLAT